ncbi:phosphate-selective porin OprO/OprP [Sphingobium xanthum]|nr:phosphate-selective porin OprO/OprP [Sphingobium sp. B10D3B]MCW2402064.1 phosphate-selective porin OprO/OprP [Sphingobium sp. B10D7B]MCW2409043.1 phosphate-selective porin OprO/OprP [Sphingobium xanthum]
MRFPLMAALLAASALTIPAPVLAQASSQASAPEDVAALRAEITRLRAQLESMEARLGKVEGTQDASSTPSATPEAAVASAQTATPAPAASAKPDAQLSWRGAPQFSGEGGLSFKPRGRLQLDTNVVSRPDGINAPTLGWSADVRRAYLGADGTLGGGFGYRLELDFASGSAQFTDAWLTYERGQLTLTVGHHRITTLEDLTSDLETSFLERAAYTQAFGLERRLGLSATYRIGDLMLSAGAFADDLAALGTSGVTSNSYALDGRLVFMPKLGDTQLHIGGSLHHRELNDLTDVLQYRARPGARTTDVRFVDTGLFSASAETGYGLEFAALRGRWHVAAEGFWQQVARPGLADPTFFGGYGEVGYILAGASGRGYRNGAFGSIKPTRGLDKGGSGAWQLNLRYDWLDLDDGLINGGREQTYGVSLIWVPIERVKFLANYLRVEVRDTPVVAGTRDDYGSDVFGLRAQYEF